jgi:hypothetical protein
MEHKRALAIAAATTATLGCAIVAGASIGGYSLLGFGSSHHEGPGTFGASLAAHQKSVTKYRDVYDKYVVDTAPDRASASANDDAAAPAPTVDPALPGDPAAPGDDAATPRHSSSGGSESPNAGGDDNESEPPTTVAPTPPTSAPSSPPTTRQRIEIPEGWPADQPLPPMPANCAEPHLEDNGVWNCGSDD